MSTNLENRVAELEHDFLHCETIRHEDGTVSMIVADEMGGLHGSPRDDDGNVATLIMEHRDYLDLDQDVAGLAEARQRWELGFQFNVGTEHLAHYIGRNQQQMMERYLSIFRPDVACYVDRWEVTGHSQGDWAYGWGYVTREALAEAGYSQDNPRRLNGTLRMRARALFNAEVEIYEKHFRHDYYGVIHLAQGVPVVVYGDHGAYVDDYEVAEDSCWGFLGYEDPAELVEHFTDSPAVAA